MKLVKEKISRVELMQLAKNMYGDFVKAVVDIELHIMAVGGEMHADEESMLLEQGSKQSHLWGINIYPEKSKEDWIEFDSLINIRPSQGYRSRFVEDAAVREKIISIVNQLII